jgi:ribonuclease-3
MLRPFKRLFWSKRDKEIARYFKKVFNFSPRNIEPYHQALLHASVLFLKRKNKTDKTKEPQSNERLEFLGDAILGSVAAYWLYYKYPNWNEGKLTQLKSILVSRSNLNKLAINLNVHKHLEKRLFGGSHQLNITEQNVYGNALEAIFGAIFLDLGFKKTRKILINLFEEHINLQALNEKKSSFKSKLNELAQANRWKVKFIIDSISGTDNSPIYSVKVVVNDKEVGNGSGLSKKNAEQAAARNAYETLTSKA